MTTASTVWVNPTELLFATFLSLKRESKVKLASSTRSDLRKPAWKHALRTLPILTLSYESDLLCGLGRFEGDFDYSFIGVGEPFLNKTLNLILEKDLRSKAS